MSAQESCRACDGPRAVEPDENIALCPGHWNAWLDRYLGADDQPCAAHPIRGEASNSESDGRVAIPLESPPTPATQSPKVESSEPGARYNQTTP